MLHVVFCIEELKAEFDALSAGDPARFAQARTQLDTLVATLGLAPVAAVAAPRPAPVIAIDNLGLICGIDDATSRALVRLGVTSFADLAALTADDLAQLDAAGIAKTRICEQNWIEQAAILAAGGSTHYTRRVASGEFCCLAALPAEHQQAPPVALAATPAAVASNIVVLAAIARPVAAAAAVAAATPVETNGAEIIVLEQRRRPKTTVGRVLRRAATAAALSAVAMTGISSLWPDLAIVRLPVAIEAARAHAQQLHAGARPPVEVRIPVEVLAFDITAQ